MISNVVHKWLDTTHGFFQFELILHIIIANVLVFKCEKNVMANQIIWFSSIIFFLNYLEWKNG
jgi:hypothetical protein